MGLIVVGLSHKTAPVELRERLTIPFHRLGSVLSHLKLLPCISEAVILSTCNRFEVYVSPKTDRQVTLTSIRNFFGELFGHSQIASHLYQYESVDAIRHLFRVASGLDSMVIGEAEILGQVKSAYLSAHEHRTTGKITNVLFQRALFVGKYVRAKTSISQGARSIGNIAVQLAQGIFGDLRQCRVILIGAGKIAEVTARHFLSQKTKKLVVLNRTFSRARDLVKKLNGEACSLDHLNDELKKADVVITSACADKPLVTKAQIQMVMKARRSRALHLIDIAVPRNIDPAVRKIKNVYVYNIDDLKSLVDKNIKNRSAAIEEAETIVDRMARESYDWISMTLEGHKVAHRHHIAVTASR